MLVANLTMDTALVFEIQLYDNVYIHNGVAPYVDLTKTLLL